MAYILLKEKELRGKSMSSNDMVKFYVLLSFIV